MDFVSLFICFDMVVARGVTGTQQPFHVAISDDLTIQICCKIATIPIAAVEDF